MRAKQIPDAYQLFVLFLRPAAALANDSEHELEQRMTKREKPGEKVKISPVFVHFPPKSPMHTIVSRTRGEQKSQKHEVTIFDPLNQDSPLLFELSISYIT
jgi:hypothetical protein